MKEPDVELMPVEGMNEPELKELLSKNAISLKIDEARKIPKLIGRNPTMTELHIFNIQWSEHSSYKSSRWVLKKLLPTEAPNVILGPVEDSGIVELGYINGERYGIVVSHESHNHPSQVVPYEGAATGVGGIIRDVLCMGAKVIATADPLRFGNPNGRNKNKIKYIANEVINGIAGYSNAVGIPNLCGDVYFNDSFDENCLVNVVCLGILKEKEIIHSYAPENSEGYDIIIVGKATDNSGFGGAAFASLILDEKDRESNRGAVQVPDPFLKNVIIRATYEVFREAQRQNVKLGFKDMGAGGIMCSTSELCSDSHYGCVLELDKVNVGMQNLPPYIIVCSETQERFVWISPKSFTKTILKIYNEDFELPNTSEGARAVVAGRVTKEQDYVITHKGKVVCSVPIKAVTKGISYERERKEPKRDFKEPKFEEPEALNEYVLKVLAHPNIASKAKAYKHYDTNVLGNQVIQSGYADAGVIAPVEGSSYGVALKTDCNPKYCRIDPYWGAVNAVAESMRNVAAVGAMPVALTDCLNFGNPESPEAFWDFYESVRGIGDAAKHIHMKGTTYPVPVISGNVSFYNESAAGKAVDPSPVIACIGIMEDYSRSVTMKIKQENSALVLVGERKDELGGSIYYDLFNETGANVPKINFENEKNMIYGIIEAINEGIVLACHDISDGGLITAVSEMILGGDADGDIGAEIDLNFTKIRADKTLFSESSGFVVEAETKDVERIKEIFRFYDTGIFEIGKTGGKNLVVRNFNEKIVELPVGKLKDAWTRGFWEALK